MHSLTVNTKRGEPSSSQEQHSPSLLGEYLQKIQAQRSLAKVIQPNAAQSGPIHMSTQQPYLGIQNRSNSQAVRGTKGRNLGGATTNILMQVRDKVKEQRENKLGAQRLSDQLDESFSHTSNGNQPRLSNNIGSVGSIKQREELSLEHIKTPLKNVKSRINRNRTTENSNSRCQHFATPESVGGQVTSVIKKQLDIGSSESVKLRNFNQRITGKHKLQPINLTNKISTDRIQKPIHSGSYVVEMIGNQKDAISQKQSATYSNSNQDITNNDHYQQGKASGVRMNMKSRQSNQNFGRDQIVSSECFKSSQSVKIPLLNKDKKRTVQRKQTQKLNESSVKNTAESRTPDIDQNSTSKDELMVTFFDKSLVGQKRMSQEDPSRINNGQLEQQDMIVQDHEKQNKRQSQHDSIVVNLSHVDGRRQSTQSDGELSHNAFFNEVLMRASREGDVKVKGSNSILVHAPTMQHNSQKNLCSLSTIQSREGCGEQNELDKRLNGSMVVSSSSLVGDSTLDLRNLNPLGPFYSNKQTRRRPKPSISLQKSNEPLSSQGGRFFDEMQSIGLGSQDSTKQITANESSLPDTLNRSMLVQECDLSQAGVSSCGAVEMGCNDESEYLNMNSIPNNINSLKHKEPLKQLSSNNSSSVQQLDHSGNLTKTFNLRNKISAKSKINMKSFLLNQNNQKQLLTPNQLIIQQQTEIDRASQRSIVESTNAYILAAQQQQEQNRMQYLQSAGTIPGSYQHGNGLSDTDLRAGSRYDFVASSSVPYRATLATNPHSQQRQNAAEVAHQSHFPLMHQSGRMLEPLTQYSLHHQPLQHLTTEDNLRNDLDPNIALQKLRQDVLAPQHTQFELKSRQSQLSNNSMNLPHVSGALSRMTQKMNSQYQTIAQTNEMKLSLEQATKSMSSVHFSAEKNRIELSEIQFPQGLAKLQNQKNIYSSQQLEQHFNSVPPKIAGISKFDGNIRMQPSQHSKNTRFEETYKSNNEKTTESENPFKKGPKLHHFKKNRRLKTSSAALQLSDEGDATLDNENPPTDVQTMTIAQRNNSQAVKDKKIAQCTVSPETNNTTIPASQQSLVYSTIEQKSLQERLQNQYRNQTQLISVPNSEALLKASREASREQQEAAASSTQPISRVDFIASAANSYMSAIRLQQKSDKEDEEDVRPLTSQFQTNVNTEEDENPAASAYKDSNVVDTNQQEQSRMFKGLESLEKPQKQNQGPVANASNINIDYNATAKFNVVNDDSGAGYAMNGSRHSFYGQSTAIQPKKEDCKNSPHTKKKTTEPRTLMPNNSIYQKQVTMISSKETLKRNASMENRASRIVKPVLRNNNKQSTPAKTGGRVNLDQTFSAVNIASDCSPGGQFKNKLQSRKTTSQNPAIKIYSSNKTKVQQKNDSKTKVNQSSCQDIKKVKNNSSIDEISHDKLTCVETAKTPCFIPTPDYTDAQNWSALTSQDSSQQRQSTHTTLEKSKKVEQMIRQSSHLQRQSTTGPENKYKNINTADLRNIEIEMQNSASSRAKASDTAPSAAKEQKASQLVPALSKEDLVKTQQRLEEALQTQASYSAMRRNLQSSNQTYRQNKGRYN